MTLNDTHPDDYPRSMRDPEVRRRRREMLTMPHVAPLTRYATRLRARPNVEVPDFDPLDGGINAKVLFLFEKPGPMTATSGRGRRVGSGFISRNNDDDTAEATHRFMKEAGLPRQDTITWNTVPWWSGIRRVTRLERAEAACELENLIALLPDLHTVVLVGRTAGQARPYLKGLRVLESAHPSPQVRYPNPNMWKAIPGIWRQAKSAP